MKCSKCGKKASIFGGVKVGEEFLCKDCYNKMREDRKRKEQAIPWSQDSIVLSKNDYISFGLDVVKERLLKPNGIEVIEEFATFGQTPNLICTWKGRKLYLTVRVTVYPDEIMPIPYPEKREYLIKAEVNNALCAYADVYFKPHDLARAGQGPYLNGCQFDASVEGLKQIRRKAPHSWVQETLEKISTLEAKKSEEHEGSREVSKSSEEPIRFSLKEDYPHLESEYSEFSKQKTPMTFQEKLLQLIQKKDMSNPQFYNAAMIDRKLFSTIKNNRLYKPKKETAVACCFGLDLNLPDSEDLLEAAGYKLSLSILWDRIVYFCLDHGITDLDLVNELLYEAKQKCIGAIY